MRTEFGRETFCRLGREIVLSNRSVGSKHQQYSERKKRRYDCKEERLSHIPHSPLGTIIPHQPRPRSRRSHRRDIDDGAAALLLQELAYNGRGAEIDTLDVEVETFVEIRFRDF